MIEDKEKQGMINGGILIGNLMKILLKGSDKCELLR